MDATLLITALYMLSPIYCESVEYYVTPTQHSNSSTDCPLGKPCHTLDNYALNTSLLSGQDNVSLLFLEGKHELNFFLNISNIVQLYISAYNDSSQTSQRQVVNCNKNITFHNIVLLQIQHLNISGNANIKGTIELNVFFVLFNHLTLQHNNIECTKFHQLKSWDTAKAAFHNFKSIFSPRVNHSYSNSIALSRTNCSISCCFKLKIANSHFDDTLIKHYYNGLRRTDIELLIINSNFVNGKEIAIIPHASSCNLSIGIVDSLFSVTLQTAFSVYTGLQQRNNSVNMYIVNSTVFHDSSSFLRLHVDTTYSNWVKASVYNCTIVGHAWGIRADIFMNLDKKVTSLTDLQVDIRDTVFEGHECVVISDYATYASVKLNMSLLDCILDRNHKALRLKHHKGITQFPQASTNRNTVVTLRNITVQNSDPLDFSLVSITDANLTIHDCKFINNLGTAVDAYYSDITLSGETVFTNNSGIKGGALSLHHSFLYISEYSSILFINNYAKEVGGAIYLKQFSNLWTTKNPPCFYQIAEHLNTSVIPNAGVRFHNNTASNGGDDIYGGSLFSPCTIFNYAPYQIQFIKENFPLYNGTSLSSISSDPRRVCLCDSQGKPRCAHLDYIYRDLPPRYPGELFSIAVVVVGNDFGTVPGIVYSKLVNSKNVFLENNQYLQKVSDHLRCTHLNFSIQSSLTNITLTIQLQTSTSSTLKDRGQIEFDIRWHDKFQIIQNSLLHHPVVLNFMLQDCPIGFTLTTSAPFYCTCHARLIANGVTECVLHGGIGMVLRKEYHWVSVDFNDNLGSDFIVSEGCRYDYCIPKTFSVDLRFPDKQCSFNRSGILCGSCYGNFSLVLGTSRCLSCDNRYVSLLLAFILAGIALVFFIKVLDLTVAKGTINGLVFYANIVWANKRILFPTTETLHPVQQILNTFIAWLNLDLGVETCFIDGLNAYWKTWLQFVFPFYIWSIAGVVIISSRYSTRVSKVFGNNSVPVLATLILLSYTKLLHTVVTSLSFSMLNYERGTIFVWSFDGNLPYLGAAHMFLFLAALAVLLLLWLPYTAVLLTLQWLRRKSNLRPLRWINRWKPFFDAYFGQLKPTHYYWVGLLLIVRVFLLVISATTSAVAPRAAIFCIIFVGISLLAYSSMVGRVYEKRYVSIIENLCIINAVTVSAGTLYNDKPHDGIIYSSVAFTLVLFAIIVTLHICLKLRLIYKAYFDTENKEVTIDCSDSRRHELDQISQSIRNRSDSSKLREPLLDCDSM